MSSSNMKTTKRLSGHTILVTGAGRGIGAAIAKHIIEEGGEAILTDRHESDGVIKLDVTDKANWDLVIKKIDRPIDGLVHAAGICPVARLEDTTLEVFQNTNAVNTEGAFLGAQACWPLLKQSKQASIVFIASMAANITSPLFPAYSASKAGLIALAKSIALSGARLSPPIRCNTVSPGFVRTEMLRSIGTAIDDAEQHIERSARSTPFRRVAEPSEIAAPVCFMLSADASYITGQDLIVDGGVTAQ